MLLIRYNDAYSTLVKANVFAQTIALFYLLNARNSIAAYVLSLKMLDCFVARVIDVNAGAA